MPHRAAVQWPAGGRQGSEGCDLKVVTPKVASVKLTTSNGAVSTLGLAGPATLKSSNGEITVRGHDGTVNADTSNGAIVIDGATGSVDADTSNGSISVTLAGGTNPTLILKSSNGSVDVTLPAEYAGTLALHPTCFKSFCIAQFDAVVAQHVRVIFQVMAQFAATLVLEQRLQQLQHLGAVQLIRRAGIGVRERHVGRRAGLDRERHADDLGLHVIERRRFRVEGEDVCGAQCLEPAVEVFPFEHELVVAARRRARDRKSTRLNSSH